MKYMDIDQILEAVSRQELTAAEAKALLSPKGFAEMNFACVDTDRERRCGWPEVIYGAGKTAEQIIAILERLRLSTKKNIMATRCDAEKAAAVLEKCPGTEYDPVSRIVYLRQNTEAAVGCVAVLCAGTSDLPVAEEAALTAELMGAAVERAYDVGVAGLHRLLARQELLSRAKVVVVAAGMEGALPSVVGGLTAAPLIAVPTSIGYGASFQGLSALLAMLNSCASGMSVVNIDNGFGAGYLAAVINAQSK
ncbi:MAG: nickel pincer cofactor biosynthesis protein LarB [Firmicutes bacterium]|nr:nickel pincer cofactor biosynthesis protein LarB [Bacillota bacterium]